MINNNYSTEEIANKLATLTNTTSPEAVEQLENCLYHLKTIAENEFNQDYFRTFYNTLEKLCEVIRPLYTVVWTYGDETWTFKTEQAARDKIEQLVAEDIQENGDGSESDYYIRVTVDAELTVLP